MTLQVLHYDFLGPIPLSEWGPPMEKVVYLLLSRNKEKFTIIYASECEKTDSAGYFTKNPLFKRWIRASSGEGNLYICILPLFEADAARRRNIVGRIVSQYRPECNFQEENR